MRFRHSFQVRAPLRAVADFHVRAASLGAITPPSIQVQLHNVPEVLGEGDRMEFTLGLGFLRIPWTARIEKVTPNGFTDRQLSGPFSSWVHQHGFTGIDADTTEVTDRIDASVRMHPLHGPIGLAMWISLPLLFAYRAWKTRRLLEADSGVSLPLQEREMSRRGK